MDEVENSAAYIGAWKSKIAADEATVVVCARHAELAVNWLCEMG